MKKIRILFVANVDWFFISHRLVIAEEAQRIGFEVFVAAKDTGRSQEIRVKGIQFINLSISRSGTNPFKEFKTIINLINVYKKINPDIVHHITLKPVIYGSVIAKTLGIRGVVNAIGGLGYNFTSGRQSFVQKVIVYTMRFGFSRKNLIVIFQNKNDQEELTDLGIIMSRNVIVRISGSGVDLEKYHESPFPSFNRIKILLPSRMLWDKGVKELREASNILKEKYRNKVQFILSGLVDEDNKAGVSDSYLKEWHDDNYVKWIGYQKNMVPIYQNSHIVVLPSYREGIPKALIEACAVGRAIITTNAIGCREVVDEGLNGFKVPIASSIDLANALEALINNHDLIKKMGYNSRLKAEKEFDVINVVKKHIKIYNSLLIE
uniref:glycosyltransferase family 4 protein n=1 Tax=Flavobacterium sp. TaxID=239 RepID=UPI00404B1385